MVVSILSTNSRHLCYRKRDFTGLKVRGLICRHGLPVLGPLSSSPRSPCLAFPRPPAPLPCPPASLRRQPPTPSPRTPQEPVGPTRLVSRSSSLGVPTAARARRRPTPPPRRRSSAGRAAATPDRPRSAP